MQDRSESARDAAIVGFRRFVTSVKSMPYTESAIETKIVALQDN
jgi:hypothetical protein